MKAPKILCSIAAIAFSLTASQAVETDPVGFVSVTVPANSDAVLAVPLNRASEFKGTTSAFSATSGTVTITVNGSPGWVAGQFSPLASSNKTYAVQLASGAKEGLILPVTNNGTNTLVVSVSANDDLIGVLANGEQFDLMPYWTPSSLLTNVPAGTALFGFTGNEVGTNYGTTLSYGFSGSGWEDGDSGDPVDNAVLAFGRAFFIRNNSSSPLTISMVGSVPMNANRLRIGTLAANASQEIYFGFNSPVPESLTLLSIPAQAGDQIFGFDNSATGKNKGTVVAYGYTGTIWEDADSGEPINSTIKLQPGFGYVYRRAASPTVGTVVWQKLQSYLQ